MGSRPALRVVRDSAPPPPLPLPRDPERVPFYDTVPFAVSVIVSLFGGALLVAAGMGWLR